MEVPKNYNPIDFSYKDDCVVGFSRDDDGSSALFSKGNIEQQMNDEGHKKDVVTVVLRPESEKKSFRSILKKLFPMLSVAAFLLVVTILLHMLSITALKSTENSFDKKHTQFNVHQADLRRLTEEMRVAYHNLDGNNGNLNESLKAMEDLLGNSTIALGKNSYRLENALNIMVKTMDLFNDTLQQGLGDQKRLSTKQQNFENDMQLQINTILDNWANQSASHEAAIHVLKQDLEIQTNRTKQIMKAQEAHSCATVQETNGPGPVNISYEIYPFVDRLTIDPRQLNSIQVSCDFTSDGGYWTTIQRRVSGQTDFYRDWSAYEEGFGDPLGNFWLGLKAIHALTTRPMQRQELYIEMTDWAGTTKFARYSHFSVAGSSGLYQLSVSGYSGTAGDSFTYHNGMKFSTKDRDNDVDGGSCAQVYHGAWWYKNCHHSNLNGVYKEDGETFGYADAIFWHSFGAYERPMQRVEMKIRPAS